MTTPGARNVTTLFEAGEVEPPATVEFTGKVVGQLVVRFGLGSDLCHVVRFGGAAHNVGQTLTVGVLEVDVAGVCFYEAHAGWKRAGYHGLRRPGTMDENIPAKSRAMIEAVLLAQAERLGEQFPHAFTRLGFNDSHSTGASARAAATELATDAAMYARFAEIAEGVEDGKYVIRHRPGLPTRWNRPAGRDRQVSAIAMSQPKPVVGEVLHRGKVVGYVVDTRDYPHSDPDCYGGPLLLPVEFAVGANGNTSRW